MKLGDLVENSIWITGDEPDSLLNRYKRDVTESIDELCEHKGFFHGDVTFYEKRPEDEDVPEVPDHIQGSKVRLLCAESPVIKKRPEKIESSFVHNLDKKDLARLRRLTRVASMKYYKRMISNSECDEIIEAIGPEAAIETMRVIH